MTVFHFISDNTLRLAVRLSILVSCLGISGCQTNDELVDKPKEPQPSPKAKAILRGYLDKSGKWAIEPQFITGSSFSDGLAHVVDSRGSYIDKTGKFIIKEPYYVAGDFHEGLASVAVPINGWASVNKPGDQLSYGYINKSGKMIIKARFRAAMDFSDGLAFVLAPGSEKWGVIDKSGKMVIKPQFVIVMDSHDDDMPIFKNGSAFVTTADNKSFFIDKQGNTLSDAESKKLKQAKKFDEEGLKDDELPGERHGFVDKQGKTVIEHLYDRVMPFHDGLAAVRCDGKKWTFIDRKGKQIMEPTRQYEFQHFQDGMCLMRVRGESESGWGFINKEGKIVIPPDLLNAESFSEGLAAADKEVDASLVEKMKLPFSYTVQNGTLVFPIKFSDEE